MDDDAPLLDISWTLHYVTVARNSGFFTLMKSNTTEQQLTLFSEALNAYLQANSAPQYKDDFNNESEKTGQLRHCDAKLLPIWGQRKTCLLLVEATYQRTTHRIVFESTAGAVIPSKAKSALSNAGSTPILLLSKSPPSHLKRMTEFLKHHFKLSTDPTLNSLSLPPSLVLQTLSTFIEAIAEIWNPYGTAEHNESSLALDTTTLSLSSTDAGQRSVVKLAVLRQVINSLRITIAISASAGLPSAPTAADNDMPPSTTTRTGAHGTDATATKVSPDLKTIDLDVPHETVGAILQSAESERTNSSTTTFLGHLQEHLRKQTGLNLPLSPGDAGNSTFSDGNNAGTDETSDQPPLYVSKITTAALALSAEPGRVKFASKPVENGQNNGYDPHILRRAYGRVLEDILAEVDRREAGEG